MVSVVHVRSQLTVSATSGTTAPDQQLHNAGTTTLGAKPVPSGYTCIRTAIYAVAKLMLWITSKRTKATKSCSGISLTGSLYVRLVTTAPSNDWSADNDYQTKRPVSRRSLFLVFVLGEDRPRPRNENGK